MKKIVILCTLIILFITTGVSAKSGDIVGNIYSTDILAYVNGKLIESYNIGGKTAIVMEDLGESYGFTVWYEDEGRKLTVNSTGYDSYGEYSVKRGTVGKITGNIYETDIRVVFNAKEVKGYNIGGKTAVCIEDLGAIAEDGKNHQYGYSDYMCNFKWDENTRTVMLNTFRINELFVAPKVLLSYTDNVLSMAFDQLEINYPISSFSETFLADTYRIKPVIYNNEEIGLMYLDWKGNRYTKIDKHLIYNESKDLAVVLSYDEAVSYIEENFDIIDTRENDKAKYFLAEKTDDRLRFLITAQKTKGLVVRRATSSTFEEDENGNTFLSWYGAGTPGSGTVRFNEYFMDDELYDFEEYIKNYEASLTEDEIRELNAANEELNYKIDLTDLKEQQTQCTEFFSIKWTPDDILISGDAEYFSSSIHSNGNEYEILLDFSNANEYSGKLIDLFSSVSSGNQALPIHNEEEKYDLVNRSVKITINGQTSEKVAVKTVSWKGQTTVYMYVRDLQPCSLEEVKEIYIIAGNQGEVE